MCGDRRGEAPHSAHFIVLQAVQRPGTVNESCVDQLWMQGQCGHLPSGYYPYIITREYSLNVKYLLNLT